MRAKIKIRLGCAGLLIAGGVAEWVVIDDPVMARAAFLAMCALALWLTELVPLYVPTLVLWLGIPLLLGGSGGAYSLQAVLGWSAQPVMALFFGGFALGAAGHKHGIDALICRWTTVLAGGSRSRMLLAVMGATALLSMWMSNIAAAAMMLAALRPMWAGLGQADPFRRALLLGVAFGANFGGMATPVGSGPNALAMAATGITFVRWMVLATPLAAGILLATYFLLNTRHDIGGNLVYREFSALRPTRRAWAVAGIFTLTVGLWLLEPWHGIPAWQVGVGAAAALFGLRLLHGRDLLRLDWPTLLLIAGGLTLGKLVEQSGMAHAAAGSVAWGELHPTITVLTFVFAAATLSSVASNTATAALLIPLAGSINPSPALAVLVALGASLGTPFVISTPPNALAFGEGGLRGKDFLMPGLVMLLMGGLLVGLTGPGVLRWMGVP